MNLYSVLLVDDEEEVYSVIMKKLDWEAMGFRIAGYARNGVEARPTGWKHWNWQRSCSQTLS